MRITFKKVNKAKIYRIQYSTDRKFKKNVRTKRTGKTTYLLRKLRVRKRYYVSESNEWKKTKAVIV